jgi:hypothetical protein
MHRTESISVAAKVSLGLRDGRWLLAAVLIHALILTIPIRLTDTPRDRPEHVAFALQPRGRPPAPEPQQKQAAVKTPSRTGPVMPGQKPELSVQQQEAAPLERELPPPPASVLSLARLLDSVSVIKWELPAERASRQLGVFTPRPVPENWRPRILVEDNRFDDAVLPTKTLIIDRWLAADGSHNVVIETPTGRTLCGRAEAWNPMNPLFEPIMMFRPCGGGGERSFKMPHRYHVRRDLPDVP